LESAEVFRLALAVGLIPVVWRLGRHLRFPEARLPFALMYVAITAAYAATAFEEGVARDVLNIAQHGLSAAAGLAFVWTANALRTEARRTSREKP
jgi:uncharacterized membrane protein AbrB (regulator of aidB expression)